MDVIFKGEQSVDEVVDSLTSIVRLFKTRYGIGDFRDIQLSLTLVDSNGDDVELVDSRTSEVFRVFEVYKSGDEPVPVSQGRPTLKLIVDNTR